MPLLFSCTKQYTSGKMSLHFLFIVFIEKAREHMLDHDDGLLDDEFSEEQTDPAFIQERRAIYQLRPEEKQVLARVHERLARTAVSPSEFEPPPTGRADTAFAPQARTRPWRG